MIFLLVSQFHIYFLCLGTCLAKCLKCECSSKHFEPGEGPNKSLSRDCEIFANLCLKLYPLYVEQQSVVDSSRASDHLLPLLSLPIITQHHPANNAWDLSDISIFTSGSLIQNDEFAK